MTGTPLAQSHEKDLSKCISSTTMSLSPQSSEEHSQQLVVCDVGEITDIPFITYQQSCAAGAREEFAQEKGEGGQHQHTTLFHRLATRVSGSITHQSSEERRDELQEGQHENNDDEAVEPVRHLSSAGEHFAKKRAEKQQQLQQQHRQSEVVDREENHYVDSEEKECYKHLSAAGEHFAKKKSEGESTSLFSRMRASSFSGNQRKSITEDRDEDEEEAERFHHLSAAGEHFARKKAEKKTDRSPKKTTEVAESATENQVENSTEIDNKAGRHKHLSAAGEHFETKRSHGVSTSLFTRMACPLAGRTNSSAIEDRDQLGNEEEAYQFKYLSSAGEYLNFARKRAEKKSWGAIKMKKRRSPSKREEEETKGQGLDLLSNTSAHSFDFYVFTPSESSEELSGTGAQEIPANEMSIEGRDCDEDSLDRAFDMVVHQFENGGVDTALTAEQDVEAWEEDEIETSFHTAASSFSADSLDRAFDMVVHQFKDGGVDTTHKEAGEEALEESQNKNSVLNNEAASTPTETALSQLDEIQRAPAYTLHRDLVIGKGSYGHVCIASRGEAEGYFSSRPGKRKLFACKSVSLPEADPKYICKLQEEVNILRVLRGHVNVIRLFDVFVVENELLIITELGSGGDLFHLLATHPKLGVSEEYAAKTVSDMLSAVAFLHSLHICHRDVKIENWVLKSGNDLWSPLKLIDFGLSTHFTPGHKLSRVVGSSYYIAPQVLKKSYTEACDLWSLGVIVYMLLSGAPPFVGPSEEGIKASILDGTYSFPQELFGDVSEDAMEFVSCLISYDEEKRYTANQALNHRWLEAKCKPEQLLRCKAGAQVLCYRLNEEFHS